MSTCCRSRHSYYSNPGPDLSTIIVVVAILIVIVTLIIDGQHTLDKSVGSQRTVVTTVVDKSVKRDGDSDKYLVYTKTAEGTTEVFEITDSFLAGRFNSSDIYADIEIGKTYQFGVRGHRNHFFSWYPNIYDYEEVDDLIALSNTSIITRRSI